jgi:hypothetical protein
MKPSRLRGVIEQFQLTAYLTLSDGIVVGGGRQYVADERIHDSND